MGTRSSKRKTLISPKNNKINLIMIDKIFISEINHIYFKYAYHNLTMNNDLYQNICKDQKVLLKNIDINHNYDTSDFNVGKLFETFGRYYNYMNKIIIRPYHLLYLVMSEKDNMKYDDIVASTISSKYINKLDSYIMKNITISDNDYLRNVPIPGDLDKSCNVYSYRLYSKLISLVNQFI